MFTIAICEDEAYMLDSLHKKVGKYLEERGIFGKLTAFSSGEALLNDGRNFDLILMDMKLPGRNGIEIIRQLRTRACNSQVIFITSYPKYVFQAFDVDAVNYLIKPVEDEKLYHTLDRAAGKAKSSDSKTIIITKGSTAHILYIRDILYCESIDHKIYVHTASSDYFYFGTLDQLSEMLDDRFFRCHRSYIVNMNFVAGKDKEAVFLVGGGRVYVSRRNQQEFTQKLLSLFRNEV